MRISRGLAIFFALILLMAVTTGCVFGAKETGAGHIDPPLIDYLEGDTGTEIVFDFNMDDEDVVADVEESRTVERKLYLFDHQGYVVPVTVELPVTQSAARQAIEHLIADGPVTPLLPDGMRAVLPSGTEFTIDITGDGTAVVDFSKEFAEYQAQDEKGILEAITWTLTEFETVKDVAIWINGYPQDVMPVNGTPISNALSRKDGINVELGAHTTVGNSTPVTLYFMAQSPSASFDYYVPITRLVPRTNDLMAATIHEMFAGPSYGSGLYAGLNSEIDILHIEVANRVLSLDVGEQILKMTTEELMVSDEDLTALVLAVTETGLVDTVNITINGETEYFTFNGHHLAQPVTRPGKINLAGF